MLYLTLPTAAQWELLPLWAAAIRRADPSAQMVVAASAEQRAQHVLPRRCLHLETPFDTTQTLVGVNGLVELWHVVSVLLHKTEELVYIEPGMCLTGAARLDHFLGNAAVLFEGGETLQPCSGLMGITSMALKPVEAVLGREWTYSPADKLPAAVLLARLLLAAVPGTYLVPWAGGEYIRAVQPGHLGGRDADSLRAARVALQCDHPALHDAYGGEYGAPPASVTRRAYIAALRSQACYPFCLIFNT